MTECLGALREGLSFIEEVRLLAGLRLGFAPGGRDSAPFASAVQAVGQLGEAEREQLAQRLSTDLVANPLFPPRHPEWVEAEQAELPSCARDGSPRPAATPWLMARRPRLSARLGRVARPEVGSLAILAAPVRNAITTAAVETALSMLTQTLGERERLSLAAALDAPVGSSPRGAEETLPVPVLQCFRVGFERAAKSARDGAHLRSRFGSFLLAVALSERYPVEAQALAVAGARREGLRLLRYLGRGAAAWGRVADAALVLVQDALHTEWARADTAANGS